MRCSYSCGTADHALSRRGFMQSAAAIGGVAAGSWGGGLIQPAIAEQLGSSQKRVLNIFLQLLNLVFFWLPSLKICVPIPKAKD